MASQPPGLPSSNPSKSFWHSEPSKFLLGHRTTENLPQHADIVIIGSGITGASAAWHIFHEDKHHRSGSSEPEMDEPFPNVLMLEAREACSGATGRNGGHCQPILFEYPDDASIGHFEVENFHALQSLIKKLDIDCEFHEQQGVRGLYSETDLKTTRAQLDILSKTDSTLSARTKLVTDAEGLAALRLPTALGAVVTNIAARMWPYKFVTSIIERLLTLPSTKPCFNLQTTTPVTSITRAPGQSPSDVALWKLSTPRGQIVTPTVILATNAYTASLLPDFTDLIVPCRGQMSALIPPPHLAGSNRLVSSFGFLGEGQDDYLIQRPNESSGHLMFGGGRQCGPSLGITNDDELDENTARYLRTTLSHAIGPKNGSENGTTSEVPQEFVASYQWTGIMGFSRDVVPFVGPIPGHPGIYLSGGYTGHGMPNAWLCGRAISRMAHEISKSTQAETDSTSEAERRATESAIQHLGLPKCYILDEARLERVRRDYPTVQVQDSHHAFKPNLT